MLLLIFYYFSLTIIVLCDIVNLKPHTYFDIHSLYNFHGSVKILTFRGHD